MRKEDFNLHLLKSDMTLISRLKEVGVTSIYEAHLFFQQETKPENVFCFDVEKGKFAIASHYEQARRFFL